MLILDRHFDCVDITCTACGLEQHFNTSSVSTWSEMWKTYVLVHVIDRSCLATK